MWLIVLASWGLALALCDIKHRRLPNSLTFGGYVIAVVTLIVTGSAVTEASVASTLLAWLLALTLTLPAYVVKWLGAGDVKMLTAIGLLTGLNVMLTSYLIAGLLVLSLVMSIQIWQRTVPWLNLKLARFDRELPTMAVSGEQKLPFGALLAVGLMAALTMLHLDLLRA